MNTFVRRSSPRKGGVYRNLSRRRTLSKRQAKEFCMTFPTNPQERSPKGDHNRRLSLGLEADEFAATAGITPDQLRSYEFTGPDGGFDGDVAERVGRALEELEASVEHRVDNGPTPQPDALTSRVTTALRSPDLSEKLARSDIGFAEQLISTEMALVDPALQLASIGERARGQLREIVLDWRIGPHGELHQEVIVLPTV
jgi:hypothetical protein